MDAEGASQLAEYVRQHYSWDALDPQVDEPIVVNWDTFPSLTLPREQMFEPYRSFRLLEAAAVGSTLIISFAWGKPEEDDGRIYLLPLDTRPLAVDLADESALITLISHHIEHSLGGPRESWEPERTFKLSDKLAVVRPWTRTHAN